MVSVTTSNCTSRRFYYFYFLSSYCSLQVFFLFYGLDFHLFCHECAFVTERGARGFDCRPTLSL